MSFRHHQSYHQTWTRPCFTQRPDQTVSCLSYVCAWLIFPSGRARTAPGNWEEGVKLEERTTRWLTDWRWVRGELRPNRIILDPATSTSSSSWYRTEIELERDESQIQDSLYLWSRQDSCLQGNGRNNVIIYLLIYVEVHLPDHHIHPPPPTSQLPNVAATKQCKISSSLK